MSNSDFKSETSSLGMVKMVFNCLCRLKMFFNLSEDNYALYRVLLVVVFHVLRHPILG